MNKFFSILGKEGREDRDGERGGGLEGWPTLY